MLVIVGAAASNIFIWPPRVGIVQSNIPLALSENIWGSGNENTASKKINSEYKLFSKLKQAGPMNRTR